MSVRADVLELQEREIEQQIFELRARQRNLRLEVDRLRLQERPTYPTQAMVTGLWTAAYWFRTGYKEQSHHGDPAASYAVCVNVTEKRIVLHSQSPYARSLGETWLWELTPEEIEACLQATREQGFKVLTWWSHNHSGISMIVDYEGIPAGQQS